MTSENQKTKAIYRPYMLILIVVLSFVLMTVASYLFMRNIIEGHIDDEANTALTHIEIQIDASLKELTTMLYLMSDTIDNMLDSGAGTEEIATYLKRITDHVRKDEHHIPGFISAFGMFDIFGGYGYNGLGIPTPDDYVPEIRPWFIATEQAGGDIAITEPYIDIFSGHSSITIGRCLYDEDHNKKATICIDFNIDRLENFAESQNISNKSGFTLVLDRDLNIISAPNLEQLGISLHGIDITQIVADLRPGRKASEYRGEFAGRRFIVNAKEIENGLTIAVISAVDEYYAKLREIQIFLILLGLTFATSLSFILAYIIKKRQNTEKELYETTQQKNALDHLENILNGIDAMVYVTDPDTKQLLFVNESIKKHFGINDDYIGQNCYKLLYKNEKDEACSFCPCRKLDRNPGKAIIWEEHIRYQNRIYRNVDRYIDWPGGKKVHLQYAVDITDLNEAKMAVEKQLKQQALMTSISQNFLTSDDIEASLPFAIANVGEFMGIAQILLYKADEIISNLTCTCEWQNPDCHLSSRFGESLKLIGDLADILINRKDNNIICVTSDDPQIKKIMAPYRVNFQSFLTTFIFVDDRFFAALDFSRADEKKWSGNDKDLAILFSNILTGAFQRRAVSEQLITAKDKAEESNRSKSIFLANMSHEIRTPMNSILGMAEIQLQENELPPNVEEAFNIIYDSGNLLINIINDILDFSKIEAGKLELNPVNYDIPSLLHDTVQIMRLRYESKPLDFHLDVNENMPVMWFGDELRIKQILNNILSNAFKYTEAGTVKLTVFADDLREDNAKLIFRVSDTGRGMTEEELSQLFDEYTRFNEKDNRTTIGTGLGMSITKRILDLMGGEISVESEPDVGSTFTIRVPQKFFGSLVCGPGLAEMFQKNSSGLSSKSRIVQFKREDMSYGKVLIVDDVETNLYVAKGLLIPYGLTIETVTSGFEAIDLIKKGNVYDIIFMDHMMPKMDGMEATKVIRSLGYDHPIVALTANVIAGQADIFMANGFDEFISKPIDIRELNHILNTFISDKQLPKGEKGRSLPEEDTLSKAFIKDAGNAVTVLKDIYARLDSYDDDDMKMYVVTVHGLKSILNIIGEAALANFAAELEQAGRDSDIAFLLNNTPVLLGKIESILLK